MASFAPIRGTRAQIQATPIVDGQFLVETDQGVDNKIYMDEGSTRTIVGGNTVTGVLPELYIYSETGSVVTVEDAGGTSIPTSQVGTDHWICEVPDYGVYTVYSVLSGDTTTQSVNVTDCMIYTIDDSHFHCNVVVTYPSGVGASCQISGGGETYSAPALNPPDTSYKFVVHGQNTTYTITTNVDGATKTQTVTTGTTLDQTYEVTMPYARVNLTVETPPITGNVTCTDGITTIVKAVAPNMVFYLPNTGTWTFSGSDGVDTYDTTVEVTDISIVYNEDLSSAPNGATVLPTDDIQTWLKCAKINDKTTYSTLNDVLNDNETLQKLINSNNAMDYLVRSKSWIGNNAEGLVPILTGTSSKITVSSNYSQYSYPWKVFDNNWEKTPLIPNNNGWFSNGTTNQWIAYEFDNPVNVLSVRLRNNQQDANGSGIPAAYSINNFKVQYSDVGGTNDSDWTDEGTALQYIGTNGVCVTAQTFNLTNKGSHKYWRVFFIDDPSSTIYIGLTNLQFYSTPMIENGITNNETAMRLIGEKNYASNILIDDSDWFNAIANSSYYSYVLNVSVPTMTSDNTPSGQCIDSSHDGATWLPYKAFDNDDNTYWSATTNANQWVGYVFTNNVKVKGFKIKSKTDTAGLLGLKNFKIEKSLDNGTTWTPIYTGQMDSLDKVDNIPTNNDATTYYRLYAIDNTHSSHIWIAELQFYGREDVDETVYHVYSAASDIITATPQGGGAAITLTTLSDGHGTIAKTSLPNGTYTLTSSKAENPSNLGNNDYYSQTVTVYNGMIEIALLPDNVLYWWGWKSKNIQDMYGNSWVHNPTYQSTAFASTFNLDNIYIYNTGSTFGGIGTVNKVTSTGINLISSRLSTSSASDKSFDYGTQDFKGYYTINSNITQFEASNSVNLYLNHSTYSSIERYIFASGGAGRGGYIYALWYDD